MHPHLTALTRWLDLRLQIELDAERARRGVSGPDPQDRGAALGAAEAEVARVRGSLGPKTPPIERLAARLGLGQIEASALLMALAPELDLRFARAYAWLNDDPRRPWPTVDLALRLAAPDEGARWAARRSFARDGALGRLIRWSEDEAHLPLLGRTLALHSRVVDALLDQPGVDPALAPHRPAWPAQGLPEALAPLVSRLARSGLDPREQGPAAPLVVLIGRPGSGRRALASALASELGRPLLPLRGRGLPADHGEMLAAIQRERALFDALPVWTDLDELLGAPPGREQEAERLWATLAASPGPALLIVERWPGAPANLGRPVLQIRVPELDPAGRELAWRAALPEADPGVLAELSSRYRLNAGQIGQAATSARQPASPPGAPPDARALEEASRAQSEPRLSALALRIEPRHTWADLILPEASLAQLHQIGAAVRHRDRIRREWGFERLILGGGGLLALFSGPSGTGKTLAASVIAGGLGQPLFKIELSAVVSKYIGETEKNLERIFSEAEQRDAVLLFDEADALFGKRSQVSDARDRYANLEVAYLLQRTELYDGLVILTSNLKKNLDEAFLRRIGYAVDFPEPGEAERLRLWRQVIPPEAPIEGELRFDELAKRYKLTGGEIRNAALAAAVMAAGKGRGIGMEEIVAAVGREMGKGGRLAP